MRIEYFNIIENYVYTYWKKNFRLKKPLNKAKKL